MEHSMMKFYKYQAAGNDFVVIDSTQAYVHGEGDAFRAQWQARAVQICDRRFGIGADGILLVSQLMCDAYDIKVDIINSDGSLAAMCGNGMRCVARYLSDKSGIGDGGWRIDTLGGVQLVRISSASELFGIQVGMAKVEVGTNCKIAMADGRIFKGTKVDVGNPHFVICIDDEDVHVLARKYGEALSHADAFEDGANVEFTKHVEHNVVDMAVYERGCGITLACGTGATASSAVWSKKLGVDEIEIRAQGGKLRVSAPKSGVGRYILCGDAKYVFEGEI